MKKILYIVGQTATGKTNLAIKLAKHIGGEIINADSRQVYIGMDIGTGKDLDVFKKEQISCRLCNALTPNQEWSLSRAIQEIRTAIRDVWNEGKYPIVVGGTGLYLQYICTAPQDIFIPQNKALRKSLKHLPVQEIQEKLKVMDLSKYISMNDSDRQNTRRLIRALEICEYKKTKKEIHVPVELEPHEEVWIGLKADNEILSQQIHKRIEKRLQDGMLEEVKKLTEEYPDWENLLAFSATGYRECRSFLEGKITKPEMITLWHTHELQYAKRQWVWFKKREHITWFDANTLPSIENLEKRIKT